MFLRKKFLVVAFLSACWLGVATAQQSKPFIADYRESDNSGSVFPRESKEPKVIEGRYYRDRQGRMRQEDWKVDSQGRRSDMRVIVVDPQQGVNYRLLAEQKLAIRTALRTREPGQTSPPPPQTNSGRKWDLGQKVVEGLEAHGYRGCTAAGRCVDTWWVPDLGYVVRMVEAETSSVVRVKRWYNFQIDVDPDPSLFEVPADFQVIDRPRPPADLDAPRSPDGQHRDWGTEATGSTI